MHTFALDDVEPAPAPPEVAFLGEVTEAGIALMPEPATRVLRTGGGNELLAAVHVAFAEHRPLVLSPDAIWLTLAHGVAQHVRLHAEELREGLVRHAGRKKLTVQWDRLPPVTAQDWREALADFTAALSEQVGGHRARLMACDFSTSGAVERAAGDVLLLDTFSPYYGLYMQCICGIPEITLTGTVEDWQTIRVRVDVLDELGLGFWTPSLRLILDHFASAAGAEPDLEFWKQIYKPVEAYGGDRITGWIARLFPYLADSGRYNRRNPMLEVPHEEYLAQAARETKRGWLASGVANGEIPPGTGQITVHIETLDGDHADVSVRGGVMAVRVDERGRLEPIACLTVSESQPDISRVIERLTLEHEVSPPRSIERRGLVSGAADIIALYEHIGDAVITGARGRWTLLPWQLDNQVNLENVLGGAYLFAELSDGSVLAALNDPDDPMIVRLERGAIVRPEPAPDREVQVLAAASYALPASDVVVVGATVTEVLLWALDHDASTDLPSRGVLSALLPRRR